MGQTYTKKPILAIWGCKPTFQSHNLTVWREGADLGHKMTGKYLRLLVRTVLYCFTDISPWTFPGYILPHSSHGKFLSPPKTFLRLSKRKYKKKLALTRTLDPNRSTSTTLTVECYCRSAELLKPTFLYL